MKTFTLMQATGEVVENAPVTTSEVAVETTTTQQDPASATETEQAQQGGSPWTMWIMLALIFGVMYFFMIRPQNKKQKEIMNFRKNLEVGQEVISAGGIYGKVKAIEDNVVVLEIASGVKIRIDKNSIYANAAATQQTK